MQVEAEPDFSTAASQQVFGKEAGYEVVDLSLFAAELVQPAAPSTTFCEDRNSPVGKVHQTLLDLVRCWTCARLLNKEILLCAILHTFDLDATRLCCLELLVRERSSSGECSMLSSGSRSRE